MNDFLDLLLDLVAAYLIFVIIICPLISLFFLFLFTITG